MMKGKNMENSDLLNEYQVAVLLGFQASAIRSWRVKGTGPMFVKISGRGVRYRKQDIDSWVEAKLRSSTSDVGPKR